LTLTNLVQISRVQCPFGHFGSVAFLSKTTHIASWAIMAYFAEKSNENRKFN